MISIKDLDFYYRKKAQIFKNLNLQLQEGKIYGLLGKNGTGKSTLLKLISGVLFPTEGELTINGVTASDRNASVLEDIFFLSENYETPNILIKDYIRANAPFFKKFDIQKFAEILHLFEVDYDSKLNNLSFGQRKKVLIAFGMATNARYLLLDEPTNGLDIPSKSQFRKVLLSGFRDDQIMIISTHQVRDLNQLIESVIVIEEGRIIFNQHLNKIEETLIFKNAISDQIAQESIHSELIPGGYIHLLKNENKQPSEVELEVLFNAVVSKTDDINQLFKS